MTDEQIMEAVRNGDLQQAAWLFDRYHRRLFHYLAKMTMDGALAEDLTQNVFLRMIRYRNTYKPGMKFQAWIFQIARNVFSDHYQKQKPLGTSTMDVQKVQDHLADQQEEAQAAERERLLHRSMALLETEQRELLVLTRFQNLKYEEVASMLNISVANVKVKVHRAISRLRSLYFELENN